MSDKPLDQDKIASILGSTYRKIGPGESPDAAYFAMKSAKVPENLRPLKFEGRWLWHNHDHPLTTHDDHPDHLPGDVFARLDGFLPRDNPRVTEMVKAYQTYDEAMAALMRAISKT